MMRKIIPIAFILCLTAAGAVFADFSIGLNGALQMDDQEYANASGSSVAASFRSGEGIYYGLMAEFLFEEFGLCGSYTASAVYESPLTSQEMIDMDLNLSVDGHILGSRSIVDPLIGVGLGYIFKDFAHEADDDDPDNPVSATTYWFLNAGMGLNFGPVGAFLKFYYNMPLGAVQGSGQLSNIKLEQYALKPYKIVLGAKVMFPLVPKK